MSRKHHCKHPMRSRSHYAARLAARGLSKAPELPDVERLRSRQTSDWWLAEHPEIVANLKAFFEGEQA